TVGATFPSRPAHLLTDLLTYLLTDWMSDLTICAKASRARRNRCQSIEIRWASISSGRNHARNRQPPRLGRSQQARRFWPQIAIDSLEHSPLSLNHLPAGKFAGSPRDLLPTARNSVIMASISRIRSSGRVGSRMSIATECPHCHKTYRLKDE